MKKNPPNQSSFVTTSSQLIVVKQVQQTTQVEARTLSYKSQTKEKASARQARLLEKTQAEHLPELEEGESQLSWWQVPMSSANRLLGIAQHPEESKKFSKKDLQKIYEYTNYQTRFIAKLMFDSTLRRLKKRALTTIGYLAQNKIKLESSAVDILIKNLASDQDPKILVITLYALSFAIHNGQHVLHGDHINQFTVCIRKQHFSYEKEGKHFLLLINIVGLSALAKLGVSLENSEVELLLKASHYLQGPEAKVFPIHSDKYSLSNTKNRLGWWFTTFESEVLKFKKLARDKNILYADELRYLIQRVGDVSDVALKRKVFHIFKYAVLNGQYQFPEEQQLKKVLNSALYSDDRKTKFYALFVLSCLHVNKVIGSENANNIDNAISPWRLLTLTALNIQLHRNKVLTGGQKSQLEKLCRNIILGNYHETESKIKSVANLILFYINGDISKLELLMLDSTKCLEALKLICEQVVDRGGTLTPKIIENLGIIIANANCEYPPLAAPQNALAILSLVAEKKEHIKRSTLDVLLKKLRENRDRNELELTNVNTKVMRSILNLPAPKMTDEFIAAIWLVLGRVLEDSKNELVSSLTDLMTMALHQLKIPEQEWLQRLAILENLSFFLTKTIECQFIQLNVKQIEEVINCLFKLVSQSDYGVLTQQNIVLFFYLTAKNKILFSSEQLVILAKLLSQIKQEDSEFQFKPTIIDTIHFVLQHHQIPLPGPPH